MKFKTLIVIVCFSIFVKIIIAQQTNLVNTNGTTLTERFLVPKGYLRIASAESSFASFLQTQPLKPDGSLVHLYNGAEKQNKVAAAILNVDVGSKDLQQCADAVMRLRAEYLYKSKQYEKLHFKFTNGFNALYTKWREGYRITVSSNKVNWVKQLKKVYHTIHLKNICKWYLCMPERHRCVKN